MTAILGRMMPASEYATAGPTETVEAQPRGFSRWLPAVALVAIAGIALITVAYSLARGNESLGVARLLYWTGLAAIVAGPAARLLAGQTSRAERVALLALSALALYAVKALHDTAGLTFSDELIHLANARGIVDSGTLYGASPILPITSQYPGLASAAAGLSQVSGLSLLTSALVLVGAARLVLALGAFLLFERLSGDARIASVGVLLYGATPNFLYWGAQFSYESLTLPLFVVALLAVVSRDDQRRSWTALACLLIATIGVTHHLSSYALAGVLWLLVIAARFRRTPAPLGLALFATAVPVAWLFAVATSTRTYLGSIFSRAADSVGDAFTGGATRVPFESAAGGGTPLGEALLGVAGVALVVAATVIGLRHARRHDWRDDLARVLAAGAILALLAYALRVVPGAWEVANRSSDFIFLGVGLVAALAVVRIRALGAAAAIVLIVLGSSVVGWPSAARLPRAQAVAAGGTVLQPQGTDVADWAEANLPRGASIVTDETSGRLLALRGFTDLHAGRTETVPQLLSEPTLESWQLDYLRREHVDYVILDRRRTSADNTTGFFFPRPGERTALYPAGVRDKFARLPGVARVFDSGDVIVYDIQGATHG